MQVSYKIGCEPNIDNVRVTMEESALSLIVSLPVGSLPILPYTFANGCILP